MAETAAALIECDSGVGQPPLWKTVQSLVLDGLTSPHTRRAYEQALEEFLIWLCADASRPFTKATVQKYRGELHAKGLASSSINVRISAIRKLAQEAADNGLLAPEMAAGIARVRGVRRAGVRLGSWLSREQAERLLSAPDTSTVKGARDTALLAVLLGAGLRRSEAVGLTFEHIQQREDRWVIADLVGKHNRIRTVPITGLIAGGQRTSLSRRANRRQFRRENRRNRSSFKPASTGKHPWSRFNFLSDMPA